jgi:hypothetical protein
MRSGQLRYALRKFREREGGANAKAPLLELLGLVFYFYFDFLCYEFSFLLSVEALNRESLQREESNKKRQRNLHGEN